MESKAPYPHCDSLVLHAPGECVFCDKYPELQAYRTEHGLNFTGHGQDMATARRDLKTINLWFGNRPQTQEELDAQQRAWDRNINLLVAQKLFVGEVRVVCDRCHNPTSGYTDEQGTSGFYSLLPDAPRDYPWPSFFAADEVIVCDACMWADPRYIKAYGSRG